MPKPSRERRPTGISIQLRYIHILSEHIRMHLQRTIITQIRSQLYMSKWYNSLSSSSTSPSFWDWPKNLLLSSGWATSIMPDHQKTTAITRSSTSSSTSFVFLHSIVPQLRAHRAPRWFKRSQARVYPSIKTASVAMHARKHPRQVCSEGFPIMQEICVLVMYNSRFVFDFV